MPAHYSYCLLKNINFLSAFLVALGVLCQILGCFAEPKIYDLGFQLSIFPHCAWQRLPAVLLGVVVLWWPALAHMRTKWVWLHPTRSQQTHLEPHWAEHFSLEHSQSTISYFLQVSWGWMVSFFNLPVCAWCGHLVKVIFNVCWADGLMIALVCLPDLPWREDNAI